LSQEKYTDDDIQAIINSINERRLKPYIQHANNNDQSGARLYLWNMEASSAFWSAFHILEVTLRNSIDTQMRLISSTEDWLEDIFLLHTKEIARIEKARNNLHKMGKSATHDRTIAELNFGFWISLFQNNYHQALWAQGLSQCFPNNSGSRKSIHQSLENLRILRNRIAHHEPIFRLNLSQLNEELTNIIAYMDSNLAELLVRHSTLKGILAQRVEYL
jgi:hypothetical protein